MSRANWRSIMSVSLERMAVVAEGCWMWSCQSAWRSVVVEAVVARCGGELQWSAVHTWATVAGVGDWIIVSAALWSVSALVGIGIR